MRKRWTQFRDSFLPNVYRNELTTVFENLISHLELQLEQQERMFMSALQDAEKRLADLVEKASGVMAAAVAQIQKDMSELKAALAAADTSGDAAAVSAATDKLQASVDALAAVTPVQASPAAPAGPAA